MTNSGTRNSRPSCSIKGAKTRRCLRSAHAAGQIHRPQLTRAGDPPCSLINEQLIEDSLVYRYNVLEGADTGFPGREGTFSMCSFWNVECLARAGDPKLARFYFEKTLGYANHLGLFSEELGLDGEQLGNFPQAFTHLGLISAAYSLDHKLDQHD